MLSAHKLKEIRQSLGLNQNDFADKIAYSREVVSKIENGKMDASKWFEAAVLKLYNLHKSGEFGSDVNILGKFSHGGSKRTAIPYMEQRQEYKNIASSYLVPLVGIKAQAGYVKGFEETDFIETLDKYSLPPGVDRRGLEWNYFEVDGDSMEPSLSAGDVLLTSLLPQEDWADVKNFSVYVILTKEQLLVKRVYRKNDKEWILISDNDEANPQVLLNLSNVKQVWTLRRQIRSKVPQPKEFKITA
jgi:DNA-binding XRE family transcriptional regulator